MPDTLAKISYLILHCSDTEDGEVADWDAIRRYHRQVNGWRDIGYHYGIERVGNFWRLQLGRPPWVMGAHCKAGGRNHDSLGLCVVGRFDDAPPDRVTYETAVMALTQLAYIFRVPPERVCGHREFETMKSCPGRMWDLDQTRIDVAKRLGSETVTESPAVLGLWR